MRFFTSKFGSQQFLIEIPTGCCEDDFNSNSSFKIENNFKTVTANLEAPPCPAINYQHRKQRSVRFSLSPDKIWEIPHIDDISQDEIKDVWMSPTEQKHIRRNCRDTIRRVYKFTGITADITTLFQDGDDHCVCVRGLEQYQSDNALKYQETRQSAYEAVFQTQKVQQSKLNNFKLPELIAVLYRQISEQSKREAHARALRWHAEEDRSKRQRRR
jgi:hypothetical protein